MATESPIVSMAPTRVTNTNAGSSTQNSLPNDRSKPGQPDVGMPTQSASATRPTSYSPKSEATTQPSAMPMTGAHSRHTPDARKASTAMATRVAVADTGAAAGDAS